ncbi:DUF350 domain-containing protein [Antrihabitans sp. YC2-6]|uniref:DUF350 domain-containing protein n=1 Tax=Antrihabitans sp. YC2-6 TaxID=2799498 RepID=UPI0018F724AB|nr:DUF350 domain-containing protein [Antrihabitans sp. YC2-6]MBJ8344367.1 DUF350 domain-containing protein [Antrihabitans sp. YC2-6]
MTNQQEILVSTSHLAVEFGSVSFSGLGSGLAATIAYFFVGTLVLWGGFVTLDLLTPGNLRQQVYVQRNPNAAILLGANHIALAIVVTTAIVASDAGYAQGLVESAAYGVLGIVLQAVALRVVDLVVPGHLRTLVDEPEMSGAAWAVASTMVAVGLVNAAALT